MAKSKKRRKNNSLTNRVPRGLNTTSKAPLSAPYFSHTRSSLGYFQEDRRNYNPEPHKLWKTSNKKAKTVTKTPINNLTNSMLREINTFQDPKRVLVCLRRKQRKEILFAINRTGSGNRKPRRTSTSNISCKG